MKKTIRYTVYSIGFIFLFAGTFSCNSGKRLVTDNDFFCLPQDNEVNIEVDRLVIEELLPNISNTSYIGYSAINSGSLFFADHLFGTLTQFDKEGLSLGPKILQGNGPSELPTIPEGYTISDEGHHFFVGSSNDVYEFDENFNKVNNFFFYNKRIMEGNVYERSDFYTLFYGNLNLKINDGNMYMNVAGGNDALDATSRDFYKVSRIINKRDAKTGDIYGYLGRLSPSIKYMTAFQKDYFCINQEGEFVIAYEADDLMYVYDQDYKLKYSFGQPGRDMNRDYVELKVDDFEDMLQNERDTKGRYTSLGIANGLVFRTYWTGLPEDKTRLQIYDGTTMIGDVDVPDGFKVLGYIAPYYYTEFICDEEAETMKLYRFKLDR
ncbi:MAG: DUF4221 family protein [Bacteroidales bacterium]|nr:DUF4221 family protein [Bacteroidales bacterium]